MAAMGMGSAVTNQLERQGWYHIWYHITLISPPVALAATALPRIASRLTKSIMKHACYILYLWYFDVYLVCLHICVSATFCHPPLSFCWEQRTFRLCAGQSSKLLFVFLRWGKGKNTTQQTSKNMHNLMPCSSQQVFKLKKSILRFKVCCRNISKQLIQKLLFLGKQALRLIRQSGKNGKVLLHWQGQAYFELCVLVVSWEPTYSPLLLHGLPECCWQGPTGAMTPGTSTWCILLSAGESGLGLPNQPSLKLQKASQRMSWLFVWQSAVGTLSTGIETSKVARHE